MPVVTRKRTSEFAIIPNEVAEDNNLSFDARGLLCYLLAKPDNWKVQVQNIQKAGNIGRDKSYRLLNELINAGYVEKQISRDQLGRICDTDYIVYDCAVPARLPIPENPEVDIPLTENPETDDPLPENTTSGLSVSGSAGSGKQGRINKKEGIIKTQSPLPPDDELENQFQAIKGQWPKKHLPRDIEVARRAFQKLDTVDRQKALEHFKHFLALKHSTHKPPLMIQYFREKGWVTFVEDPPVVEDGYFLIKPYRPEWSDWLQHIEDTKGPADAERTRRKGVLLAKRRWPEPSPPTRQLELAVSNG